MKSLFPSWFRGDCLQLNADSFYNLCGKLWALRFPLGKLHKQLCGPVYGEAMRIFDRILALVNPVPSDPTNPTTPLILHVSNGVTACLMIRQG